jgi:ABC-2 type transport system permease protein
MNGAATLSEEPMRHDPAAAGSTRPWVWSVRRELWENRSVTIAPLVVSIVIVFAFFAGSFAGIWEKPLALDPSRPAEKVAEVFSIAALVIMGTTFLVGIFYSLDALYGERRDRSQLFWKSMPVSDWTVVLAKAAVPVVILPLLTFVLTVITQTLMLLLGSAILLVSGGNVAMFWAKVPLFSMSVMLLYHLVAVHGLYYAPLFCWLLLVSAWARRLPFLWAFLPLAAIGVIERIVFRTSHFGRLLGARISGGVESEGMNAMGSGSALAHIHPLSFLTSPGLWTGLVLAAAFLAGAVWLRRNREPT